MDAKDLRTESSAAARNDGSAKFAHGGGGGGAPQPHRNKSYQDLGSNSLAKVDVQTARPCAVIGPDRVVPPSASTETYLKKAPIEPWQGTDSYRRPPEYPHNQLPTRNISPRQTFQENMPRIMVPSYNSAKLKEDHNFPVDSNMSSLRNKINVPEAKYCDVPYTVNPMTNDQKNVRSTDIGVSNMNPALGRSAHVWPPGSANMRVAKPYGVPEMYQYQEYQSCAGPRPMLMTRPQRTVHEEAGPMYAEPYYHDGNIRFKPYPSAKERYPQTRYESYIGQYSNPYHPPSPFPSPKYDIQKSMPPHPYPGYSQVHLKYLDARMAEPVMNGYQRPPNQPGNINTVPFHNQVIHPAYGPVAGNCLQNKFYPYPPDGSAKPIGSSKITYDPNNKMYVDYESSRAKIYSEGFYPNELSRTHHMKGQVPPPNYTPINMHSMPPHPYYRKENPPMKGYEYGPHFRNIDPSNINNPLSRLQFSINPLAISPSDSNTSNDTAQTQGNSHDDCGYVSQSSTASIRSMDSGINRVPYDIYRRLDYRYGPLVRTSPMSKSQPNPDNIGSKDKKDINVRQYLQTWSEGEDENGDNSKEVAVQASLNTGNEHINKQHEASKQEQLYVLGLVNVPSEELAKYEHIQKVSKLPENIKGYNSIELLNQFEEVIQSSNFNNYINTKPPKSRDFHHLKNSMQGMHSLHGMEIPLRPISPLDVEAKISQSVIHKEVGCNFEIKPCSPKMMNVEIAAPVQNVLSERTIEKVTNPLNAQSPILQREENNIKSNNHIKLQDHRMSINETAKAPSCKMVNTRYSSEALDPVKNNYTLQDLESNSGVCLASLPRLDNDCELNFPEVNQQFINANKVESVITPTSAPLKELPSLDIGQPSQPIDVQETDVQIPEVNQLPSAIECEKEFPKLSKYRKIKRKGSVPTDTYSDLNPQVTRTDSVIIKNPDNNKCHEEVLKASSSVRKSIENPQQAPINLTVHSENRIHSCKTDFDEIVNEMDKPNDFAIDFSVNSNENINIKGIAQTTDMFSTKSLQHDVFSVNEEKLISTTVEDQSSKESKDDLIISQTCQNNYKITNLLEENEISNFEDLKSNFKTNTPDKNNDVELILDDKRKVGKTLDIEIEKSGSKLCVQSMEEADIESDDLMHEVDPKIIDTENRLLEISQSLVENTLTEYNPSAEKSVESDSRNDSFHDDDAEKYSKVNTHNEKCTLHSENMILTTQEAQCCVPSHEEISDECLKNADRNNDGGTNNIEIENEDTSSFFIESKIETIFDEGSTKKCDAQMNNNCIQIPNSDLFLESLLDKENLNAQVFKHNKKEIINNPVQIHCNTKNIITKKELYSPWMQKLFLYHEGLCKHTLIKKQHDRLSIKNKRAMPFHSKSSKNKTITKESSTVSILDQISESVTEIIKTPLKILTCEVNTETLPLDNDVTNTSACPPEKIQTLEEERSNTSNLTTACLHATVELTIGKAKEPKMPESMALKKDNIISDESDTFISLQERETKLEKDGTSSELILNDSINHFDKVTELKSNTLMVNHTEMFDNVTVETCSSQKSNLDASYGDNGVEEIFINTKPNASLLSNELETNQVIVDSPVVDVLPTPMKHENNDCNSPDVPTKKYATNEPMLEKIHIEDAKDDYDNSPKEAIEEKEVQAISSNSVLSSEETREISFFDSVFDNHVSNAPESENVSSSLCAPCNEIDKYEESANLEIESGNVQVDSDIDHDLGAKTVIETITSDFEIDYSKNVEENVADLFADSKHEDNNDLVLEHVIGIEESVYNSDISNVNISTAVDTEANTHCNTDTTFSNISCDLTLNKPSHKLFEGNLKDHITKETNSCQIKINEATVRGSVKGLLRVKGDFRKRKYLKRSLSESALDSYDTDSRDNANLENSENRLDWPNKRKKMDDAENFVASPFATENLCNIIQNNRRNSISTICNEENVSFCILIDNNCIIAEEFEGADKICFTEISEDCLSCIRDDPTSEEGITESIMAFDSIEKETGNEYVTTYTNSTDGIAENKDLEESWVEDIAYVETVVSDDIAEDIVISASASPRDDDLTDYESNNDESSIFSLNEYTDKVKYIYGDKMCNDDAQFVDTLYRTPQMDVNKTLIHKESPDECMRYYDKESLERVLSGTKLSENIIANNASTSGPPNLMISDNIVDVIENVESNHSQDSSLIKINEGTLNNEKDTANSNFENQVDHSPSFQEVTQDDTINSCESSVDNVFTYKKHNKSPKYVISSSPEVSSTTSDERNSNIFLKISKYPDPSVSKDSGNIVSNNISINSDTSTNRVCCKYTEKKDYSDSYGHLPSRPLITKAAQKYIPPIKESIRDLKVKLPLPHHSLIKFQQMKISKESKPNISKHNNVNVTIKDASKKTKPKFEDVLKSIDEIQLKMHKEKNKRNKKSIPRVVIKKTENGSHYASTSNKNKFNPDLTGRKWQPWVFIEKNNFIDKMALKKKTKAVFSHRKNTYVLAEKFQKYRSISNAKFIISQPKLNELKYTIRLKHSY